MIKLINSETAVKTGVKMDVILKLIKYEIDNKIADIIYNELVVRGFDAKRVGCLPDVCIPMVELEGEKVDMKAVKDIVMNVVKQNTAMLLNNYLPPNLKLKDDDVKVVNSSYKSDVFGYVEVLKIFVKPITELLNNMLHEDVPLLNVLIYHDATAVSVEIPTPIIRYL